MIRTHGNGWRSPVSFREEGQNDQFLGRGLVFDVGGKERMRMIGSAAVAA